MDEKKEMRSETEGIPVENKAEAAADERTAPAGQREEIAGEDLPTAWVPEEASQPICAEDTADGEEAEEVVFDGAEVFGEGDLPDPQEPQEQTQEPQEPQEPENPFEGQPLFGEGGIYHKNAAWRNRKKVTKGGLAFLVVLGVLAIAFGVFFATAGLWGEANTNGGYLSPIFGAVPQSDKLIVTSEKNTVRKKYTGVLPEYAVVTDSEPRDALSVKEVARLVKPSVVTILVSYENDEGETVKKSIGSGVVLTENGFILTNAHVVFDGTVPIDDVIVEAVTEDGYTYKGFIMGHDDRTDLAVVKVNAYDLIPAKFGDSDRLEAGETVVAIGTPGGLDYAGSVTVGIVSAVGRLPKNSSSSLPLIQVDAAINPGNSGGALVNEYGEIVGINSAKLVSTSFEGMGFAIPSTNATKIINDLLQHGYVTGRAWMGITVKAVTEEHIKKYNVPKGLIVYGFLKDGPLLQSDVKVGDIITEVNGAVVTSMNELYQVLEKMAPGDMMKMKVYRPDADDPTTGKEFEERFLLGESRE